VGGFVGSIDQTGGTIANCCSTGNVFGNYGAGGFHGNNDSIITNSFWDLETSIPTNGYGDSSGITGKTTLEMQDVQTYTALTTVGLASPWDFYGNPNDDTGNEDIWGINGTDNAGYPFLMWQGYDITLDAPQNVVISVTESEIHIIWDPVAGAHSYLVYSSANPQGNFTSDTSGFLDGEEWIAPLTQECRFFYVIASSSAERESVLNSKRPWKKHSLRK